MSKDVLERLKEWHERFGVEIEHVDDIRDAIAEIEYLRSLAGAVMRGESHADIKARTGHKESAHD